MWPAAAAVGSLNCKESAVQYFKIQQNNTKVMQFGHDHYWWSLGSAIVESAHTSFNGVLELELEDEGEINEMVTVHF